MNSVPSHNNNGLFRRKNRLKKQDGRVFIRRSKIINNSFSPIDLDEKNFIIHYRPQTAQLRHRRVRRKILNGAGDEKIMTPALSIDRKHMDFTELEEIFDNAIRNRLKQKPTQHESLQKQSLPKLDTRIEFSTVEPVEEIRCCFIYHIKQHKILAALIFVIFSALIGFFSVLILVK
jgi:hypothetical protein